MKNYNSTQFLTTFNTNTLGITAGFDSQNNLLSFFNNSGNTYSWNVDENQKFLGLSNGVHTLGTTLVSDQPADFSGVDEMNEILENIPLES